MGAITQVRVLGGVVGIAIAQVVLSSSTRSDLPSILSPEQIQHIIAEPSSISSSVLQPEQVLAVRKVFGDAFNQQTRMVMYFACASLVVSLFAFRRELRSFADAGRGDKRLSMAGSDKGVNRLSVLSGEGVMVGGGVGVGVGGAMDGGGGAGRWGGIDGKRGSSNEFKDDISLVKYVIPPPPFFFFFFHCWSLLTMDLSSPSQTSIYSNNSMPQKPEDAHSVFGGAGGGMPHLVVDINQSDLRVDFLKRYP